LAARLEPRCKSVSLHESRTITQFQCPNLSEKRIVPTDSALVSVEKKAKISELLALGLQYAKSLRPKSTKRYSSPSPLVTQ
jgi:hypothetical protein